MSETILEMNTVKMAVYNNKHSCKFPVYNSVTTRTTPNKILKQTVLWSGCNHVYLRGNSEKCNRCCSAASVRIFQPLIL